MIVVLPFSQFDAGEAKRLLAWIADLDAVRKSIPLLLVCDNGVPWHEAKSLIEIARTAFTQVSLEVSKETVTGWPSGPNHLFKLVVEHAKRENTPFFWVEPDCVPIRRRWLEEILHEYEHCGKPFLGALVPCKIQGLPPVHLNGNAVYPANAKEILGPALDSERAWDIAGAGIVVPLAAKSRFIQHFWGMPQLPPTFREDESDGDPINTLTLGFIKPDTALFHRNKDGTLIALLREKLQKPDRREPHARIHRYSAESESICVVQLGRYGDILNALPVALDLSTTNHGQVHMMVSQDFQDLPACCSYVRPVVYRGPFEDLREAIDLAQKRFDRVVVTQIYGKRYIAPAETQSFVRESWRVCGYLHRWNQIPLVIDQRNPEREAAYASHILGSDTNNGHPIVLFNGAGHSSPMPGAGELIEKIRQHLGNRASVVDLGAAPRAGVFCDLLGLYERSSLLITGDTGTLHLARAYPIPTIEFFADKPTPWYGTGEPRGHECVLSMRYSQVQSHVSDILQSVDRALKLRQEMTRFYMVFSEYDARDYDTIRRQALARDTWLSICRSNPDFKLVPVRDEILPRVFRDGDKRKVPYIRDLIDHGMSQARTWDYVLLFNADICLGPEIPQAMREAAKRKVAFYSHRRDFGRIERPLRTRAEIIKGRSYCGIDFFAIPKGWWLAHRHKFPDMLLGTEAWDMVLAWLIQESGGLKRDDLIYHQSHSAFWSSAENRTKSLSQQHNRKLAFAFLADHQLNPATYGLR